MAGKTYAIPSLTESLEKRQLEDMAYDVAEFAHFARQNPSLVFLVTEIGCGLAGFTPSEIAPLFAPCAIIENVHLPERFWKVINQQ